MTSEKTTKITEVSLVPLSILGVLVLVAFWVGNAFATITSTLTKHEGEITDTKQAIILLTKIVDEQRSRK